MNELLSRRGFTEAVIATSTTTLLPGCKGPARPAASEAPGTTAVEAADTATLVGPTPGDPLPGDPAPGDPAPGDPAPGGRAASAPRAVAVRTAQLDSDEALRVAVWVRNQESDRAIEVHRKRLRLVGRLRGRTGAYPVALVFDRDSVSYARSRAGRRMHARLTVEPQAEGHLGTYVAAWPPGLADEGGVSQLVLEAAFVADGAPVAAGLAGHEVRVDVRFAPS